MLKAIKTLEEDAIYLEKNPQSKLLLGSWLAEAGRGKDAAAIFEGLEGMAADNGLPGWREAASISSLTSANYLRAITIWNDQLRETITTQFPSALYSLPFLTLNPLWAPDSYPMTHVGATAQLLKGARLEGSTQLYYIALAQMEAGQLNDAANSVRQALKIYPNTVLRPLLRFYLEVLTGEQIEVAPPESTVEELADLSDSESDPASPEKPEAK